MQRVDKVESLTVGHWMELYNACGAWNTCDKFYFYMSMAEMLSISGMQCATCSAAILTDQTAGNLATSGRA